MGGLAGIGGALGAAAGGFEQARQLDLQRQFEGEQSRRAQFMSLLGQLAQNPNAHPYTQQQALQMGIELAKTPLNKTWKMDPERLLTPPEMQQKLPMQQATTPGGQAQGPVSQMPMPVPPGGAAQPSAAVQGRGLPLPPLQAQFQPPQPPASMFMSPEQQTAIAASRIGAVTGAEAGAQAKFPVYTRDVQGNLVQNFVSGTGQPIGTPFENAVSPYSLMGRGLRQVTILDPQTGQPVPATHNLVTGQVMDQAGNILPPGTPVFESSLLAQQHQGFQQVTDAAGNISLVPVTTTTQRAITQPTGPAPPKPPGTTVAPTKGAGQASVKSTPSATGVGAGSHTIGHKPVPPELADKIQQQAQMRQSAIGLIDDITRNKGVLDSMLAAGKVALAVNSDGTWSVTRAENLTDQEAQVAGDFRQLIEHANLLRGPLGATGFRGQQAWDALQAQRGQPFDDPRITAQVMEGMRSRLVVLNKADQKVLQGQGTNQEALEPTIGGHKVGDVIQHKNGTSIRITKIYDNGRFDAEPVTTK